jgi:hypothetical protein
MSIVIILIMIYTNLRLSEIHRASVDLSEIQIGRIKLKTIIKKNPKVTVNLTLR